MGTGVVVQTTCCIDALVQYVGVDAILYSGKRMSLLIVKPFSIVTLLLSERRIV
jgi:hypothetical protein